MKRLLSIILALAMIMALMPAAFAEGETETRESVVVSFARYGSGTGSTGYIFERDTAKGAKDIDGTNFTTVDAETTTKSSNNTRNDNIYIKVDGSNYKVNDKVVYFMQIVLDSGVYNNQAWAGKVSAPTVNNLGRWTIEVDMGTTVSGWYDLQIRGANNYINGIYEVHVDNEYVGIFDCRKAGVGLTAGDHVITDLGKVYVSPDVNGKAKVAFVLKEQGYKGETDNTLNTSETRLLLEDITFTPSDAPTEVAATTISTKLSWNTMYYFGVDSTQEKADSAVPSSNWITRGFGLVLDDEKMTTYVCRYTAQNIDGTEYFTQLQTGATLWPASSNAMFTIKKKVAAAGWYRVDVQGVLSTSASDYAIYVNGEYAGDYNFDNTETTVNKFGDKKQLNTVWLDSGENEISFRARTKNYSGTALFIPYTVDLVPASEPTITSVETDATAGTLAVGTQKSFTARVKMSDNTYRSFGYNDDGTLPTDDDVVIVTSSAEDVVEVAECVNVEAVDASDTTATVDPTTVTYTLKAVASGTSNITVKAIVNGKEVSSETVAITVPEPEKAPTVSFYAQSSDNTNAPITVTAKDKDGADISPQTVAELTRGAGVTVTAPTPYSGYTFRGWVRGSAANGRLISVEPTYTFSAMTHTMLTAIYTADAGAIEYYNWNGEFLGTTEPADNPTMLGYIFDKWAESVIESITRYVAQYKQDENTKYTVTIGSSDINETGGEYAYDTEVTLTSDAEVCWLRDGKVVDFGTSYTFHVWGNTTVSTSLTAGEGTLPKVILDVAKEKARMIEYDKGNYEIVEVGILFGDEGDTLTVGSCREKMNSQWNVSDHGQFSAQSDYTNARGYLIYEDNGEYKVIYSE